MQAVILGTTGDITECERCGRSDLKKTVVLNIEGDIVHYGTECASQTLGQSVKEVRQGLKAVQEQAQNESLRKMRQDGDAWEAFCAPYGGIWAAVDHFGGFDKARQVYRS